MDSLEPVFTFLRVAVALAAVLGLIWFLGRKLTARGAALSRNRIRTIARQGMGPRQSLQVLDFDETRYVLGVGDHGVTLLDSYPVPEEEKPQEEPSEDAGNDAGFAEHLTVAQGLPPAQHRGSIFSPGTWRQAAAAIRRGPQP